MTLQFLVNYYQETAEQLTQLLQSIAEQSIDDAGVIICGDGAEVPQMSIEVPFELQIITMPHRGVCATRNTLLDAANAEYVTFVDADDVFIDPGGLAAFLEDIKADGSDMGTAPFNVEQQDGTMRRKTGPCIWVFGNVYRLSYLRENKIRFPDELQCSGDMYFLWQAAALTENQTKRYRPFYLWRNNARSVTRCETWHSVKVYSNLIRAYTLLTENFASRGRENLKTDVICKIIAMMYIDYFSSRWNQCPAEYREPAEKAMAEYIKAYRDVYTAQGERYRRLCFDTELICKKARVPSGNLEGVLPWMDEITQRA